MIPPKDKLTIGFAHVAYQLQARFERRQTGIATFQAWDREQLEQRIGTARGNTWRSPAPGWRERAASMPARFPSTRWR